MKKLKYIQYVNEEQVKFCREIGINVAGCTVLLARAKLEDIIDVRFEGQHDLGRPTEKQEKLAATFGYDISRHTRREGEAVIFDIMTELNLESINEQNLVPGVAVINQWDQLQQVEIISSIKKDGTVFFKGGNGKRAWARNLRKVEK
jgi:hypothetical protein